MQSVFTTHGTRIYNLTRGEVTDESVRAALINKPASKRRKESDSDVELLHGFSFSSLSTRIRVSPDGQFIGCVGAYPPEIKMYDVSDLSEKFARRLDAEVLDFQFLSDDYRKLVFLQNDRTVELHAGGGRFQKVRFPNFGRAMAFVPDTAELYVVGQTVEMYRLDLEQGVFLPPVVTNASSNNFCVLNPMLPLLATGGDNGMLSFWDIRDTRRKVAAMRATDEGVRWHSEDSEFAASAGAFSSDGFYFCVGTSAGTCQLFDIRSCRPIAVKNHRTALPIVDLKFLRRDSGQFGALTDQSGLTIASVDRSAVKFWSVEPQNIFVKNREDAEQSSPGVIASIESAYYLNSIEHVPNSGLFLVAQETPQMGAFYLPSLGLAPRWASFLDTLTTEHEAADGAKDYAVYEDLRFVTKAELQEIGGSSLIGSDAIRAYMHGYFIHTNLYDQLRARSRPFLEEEYKKSQIRKSLDDKRGMRVVVKTRKHNSAYAAKLEREATSRAQGKRAEKQSKIANQILTDRRFASIFDSSDFAIDKF